MSNEGLVDRIYEAGAVPSLWPDLLAALAARFDGLGALLMTDGSAGRQWACSSRLAPVMADYVTEGWAAMPNRRFGRALALDRSGFVTEQDLFGPDELAADPLLQEFLLPRRIGGEIGTIIGRESGAPILLSIQRRYEDGPAAPALVRQADALRPHLARAARLSAKIGLDRAASSATLLDAVGLPAAMLGARGRPLAVNALLRAFMPAVVRERCGRLAFTDPRADVRFAKTLARTTHQHAGAVLQTIAIAASGEAPPFIAQIFPIRRSAHDVFAGVGTLLLLAPLLPREAVDPVVLQALFALTPAEARLASLISAGDKALPDIAATLGVSHETARKQLRSVFDKTGTCRQTELVALICSRRLA